VLGGIAGRRPQERGEVTAYVLEKAPTRVLVTPGRVVVTLREQVHFSLLGIFMVQVGLTGWQTLFVVSIIMVLGVGVSNIGAYLYAAELYPTRMRTWATAWGSSMSRMSSIIAPPVVGGLLAAKMGLQSVFLMFFAVLVVGLVVMVTMGVETKQQVLEEISA